MTRSACAAPIGRQKTHIDSYTPAAAALLSIGSECNFCAGEMSRIVALVVLLSLGWTCHAVIHHPKVNVYTTKPLNLGDQNCVVCLVQGFHPPEITVELMKNGVLIEQADTQEMSFDPDWNYKWMKYYKFTHKSDDEFACKVSHASFVSKVYTWEPML